MMSLMLKILAIIGCILLAALLVVVWVIVVPRHFWLEYCKADGVLVKINIGPFKFSLYPLPKFLQKKTDGKKVEDAPKTEETVKKEPQPAKAPQTVEKKAEKPAQPKSGTPKPQPKPVQTAEEKNSPLDEINLSFDLVKDVVNSAKGVMKRIFKAIKFRDVSFTLPVYAGEVHKTQKLYGAVTNGFYSLAVFLQKHLQITFKSPIIVADFANGYKDSVYFYTQITASPVLLLAAAWFAYKQYKLILENNKKAPQAMEKENNNG